MASSIPTARTNLVALLDALTGTGEALEGVAVIRSGSAKARPDRETIVVLNAADIRREPVTLGNRRFEETYAIPVRVEVLKAGSDVEAAEERMWDLCTVVEKTVLENMTLGGAVTRAIPGDIPTGEESGVLDDRSVVSGLTMNVDCMTRLDLTE